MKSLLMFLFGACALKKKEVPEPLEAPFILPEELLKEEPPPPEPPAPNQPQSPLEVDEKFQKMDTFCSQEFQKTIRRYQGRVYDCHQQSIREHGDVNGKIILKVEVEKGKVQKTTVTSNSTGIPKLEQCIEQKVQGWSFHPECSRSVTIPFVLMTK